MEEQSQTRNVIFQFQYMSFDKHRRSATWYILASIVAATLLIVAILSANYLFAVIVLLVSFLIFIHDLREPEKHDCIVTDGGIYLDNNFHPYTEFERFWILYEPPVIKNLYLDNGGSGTHVTIPLGDADPIEVRRWMRRVIIEDLDEEHEPVMDSLARILKI